VDAARVHDPRAARAALRTGLSARGRRTSRRPPGRRLGAAPLVEAARSVPRHGRFNDLDIPETLADALQPSTLALVVYDMQVGILAQIAEADRLLANVGRVLAAAPRAARADGVHAPLLPCRRSWRASSSCVRRRSGRARPAPPRRAR
jgi:hypothetical protein